MIYLLRDVYDPDEHTQVSNKSYHVKENEFQYVNTLVTFFQNADFDITDLWPRASVKFWLWSALFPFQRWRLLLTLSLVNIFYIICGFLLNFKVQILVMVISSWHLNFIVQIVRIKLRVILILILSAIHFVIYIHRSSPGSCSVAALYQAPWKVNSKKMIFSPK